MNVREGGRRPRRTREDGTPTTTTRATAELRRLGLPFRLHRFAHDSRTASYGAEASAALGIDAGRVLKTLVAEADGDPVLAVVTVRSMLDLKALAGAIGRRHAVLAEPRAAERRTGYVVGGISPIAQRTRLPLVLDAAAEAFPTVFVSAGRRGLELEIAPTDLLTATGGRVAEIGR